MRICKEYAIARGYNRWDSNLEDAFINLRVKRVHYKPKECVFYCEGLDITRIKIDTSGNYFVKMEGHWQSYPTAVKAEIKRVAMSTHLLNDTATEVAR